MKLAFLYAGQGSQHPGMGRAFYESSPLFRQAYDGAPVDFDLTETCLDDPQGVLNQTAYTQPCLAAFAVGVTKLLKAAGLRPDYCAGLSLGEYSALHCAGVLDAPSAISLVAFRGQAMADAVKDRPCGVMIDEPRIKRIKRIPMYTAFSKPSHVIWRSNHTSIMLVPGVKNRLKETVIKRIITILFNPLAINLNGTVDR